jgi:uncharacterized protein YgiM (DUF1202 family)
MTSTRTAGSRSPCQRGGWWRASALALGLFCAAPGALQAAPAWVKGEVRLNLRTGPSNEYRIIGEVHTGDRLDVLELGSGWTRIRSGDQEGWIPEGYLQDTPTPGVLLEEHQAKTAELRAQVESLGTEAAKLKQENTSFGERDGQQRSEIATLTRENLELKAGARWPEWITGAGILTVGMVMGWILHVTAGRRQRPRIRL